VVNLDSLQSENKSEFRPRAAHWLVIQVAAFGARMFAIDDRTAIQHGWTITRRRGGLARTYRDPRFDGRKGQGS
jgi:hypothetical protein